MPRYRDESKTRKSISAITTTVVDHGDVSAEIPDVIFRDIRRNHCDVASTETREITREDHK